MEVIDIGLNDLEPISIDLDNSSSKAVNFGPGIELLMNDRVKSGPNNIKFEVGDLDNLEQELNNLSGVGSGPSNNHNSSYSSGSESKTLSGFSSNLFGFGGSASESSFDGGKTIHLENEFTDSKLGQSTAESMGNTKTWDGFSKVNEIPTDKSYAAPTNLSERERRRKKRMMIKKLEDWNSKGLYKSSSHFTLDSSYEEIEDEYETAMEDKRKKDSIKLQGWWFMTFVNSVEYANAAFNPFDINLDGWGEQVSEDIDSYEEIFSELHEKYKGGKMAPELSLLLRLGFSAAVVNFTNKALSTATPGFNDVIRQSPELMKAFTNATVNSMSQNSPGFAFANNMMQDQMNKPRGPPPPGPMETKGQAPPPRPGMVFTEAPSNRQDINAARGAMFREQGVDLNNYQDMTQQDRSSRPTTLPPQAPSRPEMRGPQTSDIDNILSGLKTRNVNIHESAVNNDDDSMISISSLKDVQNGNMPKRSRRKQRSDKNTVSLDI
jgi:hypothetical protein